MVSNQDVELELYNVIGELLSSRTYKNEIGSFNKNITFGHLTDGVYFVKINTDNIKSIKKMIIQ